MPKPKQQPVRPPTAFERLADPEGRRRAADPNLTANGAVRANRAAQFMPFAALTGYYELVRKQEITVESKRELTEEKALVLSKKLEVSNVAIWCASPITIRTAIALAPESSTRYCPPLNCSSSRISPSISMTSRTLSCADEPSQGSASRATLTAS